MNEHQARHARAVSILDAIARHARNERERQATWHPVIIEPASSESESDA